MGVRTFVEADRAELRTVFERAGEGAPGSTLWGDAESEAAIYLTPYMDLTPGSLFVAVVDGAISGYLTGCLDGSLLPSEGDRVMAAVREHRLLRRASTVRFFVRSLGDVVGAKLRRQSIASEIDDARWPAHLHINLLPEVRGSGIAAMLMEAWFDQLREAGSPGCHLQTLVENVRAVRFFERVGFRPHGPTPLVPGIRQGGKPLHQRTMVRGPEDRPGNAGCQGPVAVVT